MPTATTRVIRAALGAALIALFALGTTACQPKAPPPPPPPSFTAITVVPSGPDVSIFFNYSGAVNPQFTVGTGPDVLGTQVRTMGAKQLYAGHWSATMKGLKLHTQYHYRLDDLVQTATGTFKTQSRHYDIRYTTIHVVQDGDAWPNGCGDFYFNAGVRNVDQGLGSEHCMNDGDVWNIPTTGYPVQPRFTGTEDTYDSVPIDFWALDLDEWNTVDCGGTQSAACGSLAYGFSHTDVTQIGTVDRPFLVTGPGVSVIATIRVTVDYVNW